MWALIVIASAVLTSLVGPTAAYFFEPGYSHHYTYWAKHSIFGASNITTILKFQVSSVNNTEVGHTLHSLSVDSLVLLVQDGPAMENPLKWDLSKTFLFETDNKGSVRLVHCHPEDHEELLIIKKALVSVFSVHVQIDEGKDEWEYNVVETDHHGRLEHKYHAKRSGTGMQLDRRHYSVDKVHRFHNKTLHYDERGTLHSAEVSDRILLKGTKKPEARNKSGRTPTENVASKEIPEIDSFGSATVKLDKKRRVQAQPLHSRNLQIHTLETKMKERFVPFQQVKKNITDSFECFRKYPEKDNMNRSRCVEELRSFVTKLNPAEYKTFVDSILTVRCPFNDTLCENKRLVIIDIVAGRGNPLSQDLLLHHVVDKWKPNEGELQRLFSHCVGLQHPTKRFVRAIERFCFGENGELHGTRTMNRTQRQACLAVGTLAKNLANSGEERLANHLTNRLETWLDEHEKGDILVQKRDTRQKPQRADHQHHLSKAIILHALGNAAMLRSKRHLLKHAEPNRGHQSWRRAAVEALRHYSCKEIVMDTSVPPRAESDFESRKPESGEVIKEILTAVALHDVVTKDEMRSVQRQAFHIFRSHPRRHDVIRSREDNILSENYTYPSVVRARRSVESQYNKVVFHNNLRNPPQDINEPTGIHDAGGNAGARLDNSVDNVMRPLDSHIDMDFHNKLGTDASIGLVNMHKDLVKFELCYKGRINYNVNMMKDFEIEYFRDLPAAFAKLAPEMMKPLLDAANSLAVYFEDPASKKPISGFDSLASAVTRLPEITRRALIATISFHKATRSVCGLPLMSKLRQLATRAQALMEDVHSETASLYMGLVDSAVIVLPFAEREIRHALNTILSNMDKAGQYPRQVIAAVDKALMGYKLAVQRIVEAGRRIKLETAPVSASRGSFMNTAHEINSLVRSTQVLIDKLRADHARRISNATEGFAEDTDFEYALSHIYDTSTAMIRELTSLASNVTAPFQEGLDRQTHYAQVIMAHLELLNEAVDKIKSQLNALLGQKFHPKFPEVRRPCDAHCGCGVFPTGADRYGHQGVDIKHDLHKPVHSPVSGMMFSKGNDVISLLPMTSEVFGYEILLSNIRPAISVPNSGVFVTAGEEVGYPSGSNGCDHVHINIAMRSANFGTGRNNNDAETSNYIDPTPFLDPVHPEAEWTEECNDFMLKMSGQVQDHGPLTSGFRETVTDMQGLFSGFRHKFPSRLIAEPAENSVSSTMNQAAGNVTMHLDPDPSNLKHLFEHGRNAAKVFFANISMENISLDTLQAMVADLPNDTQFAEYVADVEDLLMTVMQTLESPKAESLPYMSTGSIGRILTLHGAMFPENAPLDSVLSNGTEQLLTKSESLQHAQTARENGHGNGSMLDDELPYVAGRDGVQNFVQFQSAQRCSAVAGYLSTSPASTCLFDRDCLGVRCEVMLRTAFLQDSLLVDVRADLETQQVTVRINGTERVLSGGGEKTVSPGSTVFGSHKVALKVFTAFEQTEVVVSLTVKACSVDSCIQEIDVIRKIRLQKPHDHEDVPHLRQKRGLVIGVEIPSLSDLSNRIANNIMLFFADNAPTLDGVLQHLLGISTRLRQPRLSYPDFPSFDGSQQYSYEVELKYSYAVTMDSNGGAEFNWDTTVSFFNAVYYYIFLDIPLKIEFNFGGNTGVSVGSMSVNAMEREAGIEAVHFSSIYIRADLSVTAIVADFGLSVTGYIMQTRCALKVNVSNKQKIHDQLQLEMIPFEMKLSVFIKIFFFFRSDWTIWHLTVSPDGHGGYHTTHGFHDHAVPHFSLDITPAFAKVPAMSALPVYAEAPALLKTVHALVFGRRRRSTVVGRSACLVQQVPGRHPVDPAFKLEFSVADDVSGLKLWYAVGDYPGGTNVIGWTDMRGSSLLAPAALPCGEPLYFLVKARNSRGHEATAQCSLPTYDCTIPEGRVDSTYRCSSHSSQLNANVIMYEDSELSYGDIYHAVGYSPSSYGNEVVDWLPLNVSNSVTRGEATGDLGNFGPPRPGRLASTPERSMKTGTVSACASQCAKSLTCLSFSYNQLLGDCELQAVVEGAHAERRTDQHFQTYERVDKARAASLRYENLPLRHGTMYYVNVDVTNVLGYRSTLTSKGTMVDFTPPEPGVIKDAALEVVVADGCAASVIQRCVNAVEGTLNHRKIIDGAGSGTVLNGNRRGQDLLYSMENYHISGNWQGLKDEECGIHGYTWAVGTKVCGSDVVSFRDPHAHLPDRHDWTNTGLARDLHLPDGQYYVTVQAVSDIIHGGDLVTTVCHSTPITVDTTPPSMNKVSEFLFDETFRHLAVYYDASDDISGIARMEFGLGKTKYDVTLRSYEPLEMRGKGDNTYLVIEDFETDSGVPAWIRLKVVNNVGLSATGSSDWPILIDHTPPFPGHVMDGAELGQDACCQKDTAQICAQWMDFYDPESNIDRFLWGVGLAPGKDDVVEFRNLTKFDKESCVDVQLRHNVTYFSTVIAFNMALNQKAVNASSNGVLVDTTPPKTGTLADGDNVHDDVDYTSETATMTASWDGFRDPESGLAPYSLAVHVNGDLRQTFTGIEAEHFTDHSFSFQHGDRVHVQLLARNRAGGESSATSNGLVVDHTPPELINITTKDSAPFQQQDDVLHFIWDFHDPESGVAEYRCVVTESHQGVLNDNFWPGSVDFHVVSLNATSGTSGELSLEGLRLKNGGRYRLRVTALNRANMATAEESNSVTVDTTPPEILQVRLARRNEEEEINDDKEVEHVEGEPLWVTWKIQDPESGVVDTRLCIDVVGSSESCLTSDSAVKSVDGSTFTTSFTDEDLLVTSDASKTLYQVRLVARNGAGVQSAVASSSNFVVLKANVAGTVRDGRRAEDEDYTNDKTSIAITFSGFSSDACGIDGYEWGVGTSPFSTDVMPFTDYGLVVDDDGNGFAQAHFMLFEGQRYYSTVRAKTGHNCREEFIVASSDGFTVDTTPPTVTFHLDTRELTAQEVVYQTVTDRLMIGWSVFDSSGLKETLMTTEMFSSSPAFIPVSAQSTNFTTEAEGNSGDSVFSMLAVTDSAGNEGLVPLPPVTFDITPPKLVDLTCTEVLSAMSPLLKCSWTTIEEPHSGLSSVEFGLGSGPSVPDLHSFGPVPLHKNVWDFDVRDVITASYLKAVYVIVRVTNAAGLKTETQVAIIYDRSPPSVDNVSIVTSPGAGYHDSEQQCQTAVSYVEVLLGGAVDDESGIASVEIALGSSRGRTDVAPFKQYPQWNSLYVMGHLDIPRGSTVFATVRVTNAAGLFTITSSNGVVVSPEPRLQVLDGAADVDMDGQSDLHVLQGSWTYSDPCPVLSAEWSVVELGGKTITNFTAIPESGRHFYNDSMQLENFKTYVSFVRIRDGLNRSITAYSDGVTVVIRQPDAAAVRDGPGEVDMQYQEAVDHLSANWDQFGDARSTLPSDIVLRYEAAVGTDRRQAATRADVHGFEDVGLETNITFYGLNLTEKTATYYVTVRAYSAAGSFTESSSNGIKVGYSADVIAGRVGVSGYQSSTDSVRLWWTDFDSDMVITRYYGGVSSSPPPLDNATHECSELVRDSRQFFDVSGLHVLESDSVAVVEGLSLRHGHRYYVTVVAADEMGQCSAAVSKALVVDTTPPLDGQITAEGFDAQTVIFLHSRQTVKAKLDNLLDPESGVESAEVELLVTEECDPVKQSDKLTILGSVLVEEETDVAMRNLKLQEKTLYFLRVTVTNGAGLTTESLSRPMVLDTSPPRPGLVRLGTEWTEADANHQNQTHTVRGLVALTSPSSEQGCPTQVELLSAGSRQQWEVKRGSFTEDCAALDASGVHVFVRHNPYLTGVDRGAMQFSDVSWREGNYTFRLTAGRGSHVQTGITLGSPLLSPPFVPGNLSFNAGSPSGANDQNGGNDSRAETSLNPDSDYGLGISFVEENDTINTLFWAQDKYKLKQFSLDLDFDPSVSEASYTLALRKGSGSIGDTWDVTLLVGGEIQREISGLVFPDDVALSVYAWNIDDYLPPIQDPFKPFQTAIRITSASIPVEERPLCSYGSPFLDSDSGIKEIWAGVSDSVNDTANVFPFTLVKSFCLPCLMGCTSICSGCSEERLTDSYRLLPVEMTGLALEAASEAISHNGTAAPHANMTGNDTAAEFDNYRQPTFYLDVRVVDQGGLATDSKSVGIIVDTSPPVVNFVRIFDPVYSSAEPVAFVGNNHSVGVQWDTSEDVSRISEVWVSLGTRPGTEDVSSTYHVNKVHGKHVFDALVSPLQDGKVYHVTVGVKNEAGLVNTGWTNFTVRFAPPDMSAVKLTLPNVTPVNISGVEVGLLDNTDRLEIDLDLVSSSDIDIEYYEWSIGTASGKEDVFPRTRVGLNTTKKVALVHGYMQLEGLPAGVSIGDYAKKNRSTDSLPGPTGSKFKMEPGRCLSQRIYGVSKAHVLNPIDVMPTCVKRPQDIMVKADRSVHELWLNGNTLSTGTPSGAKGKLRIKFKLSKGAVLGGVLTDSDLDAQYGSSASTQFSPFISRPEAASDETSRLLKRRLQAIPGPHLFLSPVAEAQFQGDVEVSYVLPANVTVAPGSLVSLLLWEPDTQLWISPEELCPDSDQAYDNITRTVSARICAEAFSDPSAPHSPADDTAHAPSGRKRRSSASLRSQPPPPQLGPRMLTVAVVGSRVVNQPPVVHNKSYTMPEDGANLTFIVTYTDPEGDTLRFRLSEQPRHGSATVSSDGAVSYTPEPDFAGVDVIHISGREVPTSPAISPNSVNFSVTIIVTDMNDPPFLFYLPVRDSDTVTQEAMLGPAAGNGLNMTVYIESNVTSHPVLGVIGFGDVDQNDTVKFTNTSKTNGGAEFDVLDISADDPRFSNISLSTSAKPAGKEVALNLPENYSGHVTFDARVKDATGAFSMQLTLNVYVLLNPCQHGSCKAARGTCNDPQRAFTFDPFSCECDLGYEGQWCEVDTDECVKATCSPIRDCVDLIGGYRCDPNATKLAAIVLCCVLAVVLIIVAVCRLKKRNSKVDPSWNIYDIDSVKADPKESWTVEEADPPRPITSHTVSDIHFATADTLPDDHGDIHLASQSEDDSETHLTAQPCDDSNINSNLSSSTRGDSTAFEFLNLPLFTFHASHNPSRPLAAKALDGSLPLNGSAGTCEPSVPSHGHERGDSGKEARAARDGVKHRARGRLAED